MSSPASKPNRLSRSTSPYLLQHAHNPVDWHPWGPEAFAEARKRDVPIFLSIGYSTCYWCHVMERESFESEDIARTMNDHFVSVKVDREERPDVDDLYMAAVMAFTGRGGWPMSVFLDPHTLKPFWAGTYFPPVEKPGYGVPSFPRVLLGMADAWKAKRDEIKQQADALADAVREQVVSAPEPVAIGQEQVTRAISALFRLHDRKHGGFGSAPKFPQPAFLDLLLETRAAAGDEQTRAGIDTALKSTLDAMALGGIHDHVGGGFHRYSVDAQWLVPHFEKMLYDNAQLIATYARVAQTYDDFYRRVVERIVEYLLREMTLREGGEPLAFYSAQDAEVNGREGLNYLWQPPEFHEALPSDLADRALSTYGLDRGPNFHDPHQPQEPARNILFLSERPTPETLALLDTINPLLYAARSKREQPRLDDKVLTSWNALTIAALASAGRALSKPDYIDLAARVADWIDTNLRLPDNRLARSWRNGTAHTQAVLEDHAALLGAFAQLALSQPARNAHWLNRAAATLAEIDAHFADAAHGAASTTAIYYDTPANQPDLFIRARSTHDGALPSAQSLLLHALLDLAEAARTDEHGKTTTESSTASALYTDRALALLRSLSAHIAENPLATANATRGLLRLLRADAATGSGAQSALASAPAPAAAPAAPAPHDIVEILSSVNELQVRTGEPALLTLRFRIKPGYHINAAIPADPNSSLATTLVGLRVGLIPGSGSGVEVYADYPPGQPSGPDNELRIHAGGGEFDLPVVIKRSESSPWSGRPILGVTYQVCTDTECLAPTTVELDIALDRA